jgi:FKBP-type peptidyl-prolyl cis-trans isomerase FkpA
VIFQSLYLQKFLPMKAMLLLTGSLALLFLNLRCLKSGGSSTTQCTPKTVSSEQATITAYATANGMNITTDANGLSYEIVSPGTGPVPSTTSKVFVTYTGQFLNGSVFDQQTDASQTGWVLGDLIKGWIYGLQYIQKGGRIKLIVPSSLAYSCEGRASIPPNSILYFDLTLVDVQ